MVIPIYKKLTSGVGLTPVNSGKMKQERIVKSREALSSRGDGAKTGGGVISPMMFDPSRQIEVDPSLIVQPQSFQYLDYHPH
jgi:hypothetical protein